ncbi:MAG TPA: hypothetical protein VKR32_06675 [Puia sp.]|nr:hypothetical protein [Puia sp.]
MKKILLAAGIFLVTASVTFAQENDDRDNAVVNPLIKSQFETDFPNATNVDFESKKSFDEVSFTQDKEKISAYYDYNDQLIGTVETKAFSDLPANAQKEILKKYADYTITGVVKFNDNESDHTEMILYGRSLNDADNYFVQLKNDSRIILVKVDLSGGIDFFTTMK